jgi:hypothetical protein
MSPCAATARLAVPAGRPAGTGPVRVLCAPPLPRQQRREEMPPRTDAVTVRSGPGEGPLGTCWSPQHVSTPSVSLSNTQEAQPLDAAASSN